MIAEKVLLTLTSRLGSRHFKALAAVTLQQHSHLAKRVLVGEFGSGKYANGHVAVGADLIPAVGVLLREVQCALGGEMPGNH